MEILLLFVALTAAVAIAFYLATKNSVEEPNKHKQHRKTGPITTSPHDKRRAASRTEHKVEEVAIHHDGGREDANTDIDIDPDTKRFIATYDEGVFYDDSGRFRIPRYSTRAGSILRIKDISDHREIFDGLNRSQKESFTLSDFNAYGPLYFFEFDIDPEDPIDAISKKRLVDFGIAGNAEEAGEILSLLEFYDENDTGYYIASPEDIENRGAFDIVPTPATADTLQALTIPDLKKILRSIGEKVSGKKSDLVQRIVDSGKEITIYHVTLNTKRYNEIIHPLSERLINEIEKLVADWPPCAKREVFSNLGSYHQVLDEKLNRLSSAIDNYCNKNF